MNTTNDQPSQKGAVRRHNASWRIAAGAALGALLLTGCGSGQFIFLGDQSSTYNQEMLRMSLWAIGLSIIIFIGVSAALFITVNKFREENNNEAPQQFHGNNQLEVILVLVPVVIVILLSILAVRSMARLNPINAASYQVDALAKQFWWNFSYPSAKVEGGVVTNGNEMIMPIHDKTKPDQHIAVTTTSADVVHGFWAPNLGGQRAAIPGSKKTWNIDTDKPGVYQGNCSQLCGGSHANMRFKVIALPQDRFDTFIKAATEYKAPEPAAGSAEERGMNIFMKGTAAAPMSCAACHRVQGTPAGGTTGPDLSYFGTRRTLGAGMWEAMTAKHWEETKVQKGALISPATALHNWIKHSGHVDLKDRNQTMKPGSLMPNYDGSEYMVQGKKVKSGTLTDTEIDDVAAYLRSLKLPDEADYWKDSPIIGTDKVVGGTQ